MKKLLIFLTITSSLIFTNSCSKEKAFLDAKPDQSLIIPSTVNDYEILLNHQSLFNSFTDLSAGTATADEYYLPDEIYNGLLVDYHRNLYIWNSDIENGSLSDVYGDEWNNAYKQIFICNVVLEGLEKLSETDRTNTSYFNTIKGRALFLRSWAFYNLVQTFALPYNTETSQTDLGIPLRLSSDINAKSFRATVKECYDQVISDLTKAYELMPETGNYKTQPSGIAALGFLSRIYLAMRNYDKAKEYADLFLSKYNTLTDFNSLSTTRTTSISTTFVDEDVFQVSINTNSPSVRSRARIPQSFYDLYDNNDLRKSRYFRIAGDEIFFKGSYCHFGYHYSGIATDEIFLIRSECYARDGKIDLALNDLNHLLQFRWDNTANFTPIQTATANEALSIILEERRKELLFRGTRWTDLRRLNQESGFEITLERTIDGVQYSLPPNDSRYAMPIPTVEIELSNLIQNQR